MQNAPFLNPHKS